MIKSWQSLTYGKTDRYFGRELLTAENPCEDEAAFLRWRIKRRIGAVGLLWNRRSDAWLGIGMTTDQRNEAFAALEEAGDIQSVQVEGIKWPLYLLTEDCSLLESVLTDTIDTKARLEFLAPLDPMLWDRKLIEAIWGFQYSWEIYTPVVKRKYGYYVLPMLYGQELIGRIEAVADRKADSLIVKNVWYEPTVRVTKALERTLDVGIRRFAKFNDCEQIVRG